MAINAQKYLTNVKIIILKMGDAQPAQFLDLLLMMANALILIARLRIMIYVPLVNRTLFTAVAKKSANLMIKIAKI